MLLLRLLLRAEGGRYPLRFSVFETEEFARAHVIRVPKGKC